MNVDENDVVKNPKIGKLMGPSTAGHNPMAHPPWLTRKDDIDKWYKAMSEGLARRLKEDPLCFNATERQMRNAHEALRHSGMTGYGGPDYDKEHEKRIAEIKPELRVGHPYADKRDKTTYEWRKGKMLKEYESVFDWYGRWKNGGEEMSDAEWEKAWKYFNAVMDQYKEMIGTPGVNTTLALAMTFDPLAQRYNKGERTQDLYDAMMSVE